MEYWRSPSGARRFRFTRRRQFDTTGTFAFLLQDALEPPARVLARVPLMLNFKSGVAQAVQHPRAGRLTVTVFAIVAGLVGTSGKLRAQELPVDEFSPAFLGMYRKVMEIEPQIQRFARQYAVDFDLARAVCLYESGGNSGLSSHVGAQGYFQVMPATYRELQVPTNIEAGIKYLSQMIQQFGREDRAVAAYNAGPTRIGRGGSLPLETLQYVVGVSHYRSVIKQFDGTLRRHASQLGLVTVAAGDTWAALAAQTGISEWELRLHNPFLAGRQIRTGSRVAFPSESRRDLLLPMEGGAGYRMRHGDNYIKLAITLGIDVEALRHENGLWQTQTVPSGVLLRIPFAIDRAKVVTTGLMEVLSNQRRTDMTPISRDRVMVANARAPSSPPAVRTIHRVKRGETLSAIAKHYSTTVDALRTTNSLTGTTIRTGQRLIVDRARTRALD